MNAGISVQISIAHLDDEQTLKIFTGKKTLNTNYFINNQGTYYLQNDYGVPIVFLVVVILAKPSYQMPTNHAFRRHHIHRFVYRSHFEFFKIQVID